jgi:hypothetical protein
MNHLAVVAMITVEPILILQRMHHGSPPRSSRPPPLGDVVWRAKMTIAPMKPQPLDVVTMDG